LEKFFTRLAERIASFAGRPGAFLLAAAVVIIWAISGPLFKFSDTWQLVINTGTTIVTFLMVFLIQNSQNRDSAAMETKLDELIRALDKGRDRFIGIEHETDTEIEGIRAEVESECDDDGALKEDEIGNMKRLQKDGG
jgi:low affinity Fe/Cu permease